MKTATCTKCGRTMPENNFWKMKSGERFDLCKTCMTQDVDDREPDTFLWILKKFDIPYVEGLWRDIAITAYKRDPIKYNHQNSVLGRYVRTGNMKPWRQWGWDDSNKAIEFYMERHGPQEPQDSEEIDKVLETNSSEFMSSDVPQDEVVTSATESQLPAESTGTAYSEPIGASALGYNKKLVMPEPPASKKPVEGVIPNWEMPTSIVEREQKLKEDLTEDDMLYLATKWGTNWRPSEWIALERMYQAYADEYELNVDRENTLRQICKTSVKMDQALENDDISTYKSLAQAQDQLRKSAKFTEMQNKEGINADAVSSIGQLVAMIEKAGSIIRQKDFPDLYEQDIVDKTIEDTQRYLSTLVKNEMGLGDLIESYIEKLDKSQKDKEEKQEDYSNADQETKDEAYARAYALALEGNVDKEIAEMMGES